MCFGERKMTKTSRKNAFFESKEKVHEVNFKNDEYQKWLKQAKVTWNDC